MKDMISQWKPLEGADQVPLPTDRIEASRSRQLKLNKLIPFSEAYSNLSIRKNSDGIP